MFDVGFGELTALALVALFVFGPDRLPQVAAQAGRLLRELRSMAAGARRELGEHIDPELATLDLKGLKDLDPRSMVRDAVLDPDGTSKGTSKGANARGNGSAGGRAHGGDAQGRGAAAAPPFDPDAT